MEATALSLRKRMGCPARNVGRGRALTVRVLRGVAVLGVIAYAAHSITGFGGHGPYTSCSKTGCSTACCW